MVTKNKPIVDILIPTFNNPTYLQPCLASLAQNKDEKTPYHVYVVNNGHKDSVSWFHDTEGRFTEIYADGNKGWEGGLKLGLEQSKAPYVCFFNDDAHIPPSSSDWLTRLVKHFDNPHVGAVGPSSNVVMGMQNIFATLPFTQYFARFLIGFCVVVRRSALDDVGGVDDSLPGGDDLDLSIRLRAAGYKLIADRRVFVFHHGFKTGERVYGDANKPGGWNSYEFKERTDFALIKKHGFKQWWHTMKGVYEHDGAIDSL